ncbi:DUF1007 family protein [Pelagibacterium montanilacus]|uniref:HoxN/HupN/NixA family nickel/cobalt transporter n=1 Tax=Pelagibacterium montanilacus TaxID=2185280 RepID=UPI000F8E906D|nr:DUF1007 family protein [Pelagibacterium montanilacus]
MFRFPGRSIGLICLATLAGLFGGGQALAHPHVFIDARGELLFEDGRMSGMRHFWTFDEYFSSWAVQGLDTDGDGDLSQSELQPLAEENMVGLAFYDYYTFSGADQDPLGFADVRDPTMRYEDGELELTFTLIFDTPRQIERGYDISVGDPEYYAAFTFEGADAVSLSNAPETCYVEVSEPRPISADLEERLFSLGPDVTELPDDLRQAARDLANLVTVSCPTGPADNGLDAIADATARSQAGPPPTPFAAPPAEPNLGTGRGGLIGWIADRQSEFYRALTSALGALRADNNAFWVLGGLSFLYGVFHAAGPGHGKVVISSYMLANERQLRRGIVLSVLSALMQAVVAVAFVGVAAGFLQLTSMAMSGAANWLAVGSYAMIAVLGAWLAARKILGFGHNHAHVHTGAGHGHHHHGHHDQHPDEGGRCDHHVVTPDRTGGDWREMAGVVFSVGLRPCSGALVVLVFALTQGLFAAGVVATFAMAAGTALTVAVLAALAVGAKGAVGRIFGGGERAGAVVWWLELAAAIAVMGFGLLLLFASLA